jgi:hypothetical protein
MALQTGTRRSASLFQLDPRFGEEKLIGSRFLTGLLSFFAICSVWG